MKRLEIYIIRIILIIVLAMIAASPFLAVSHVLNGILNRTMETTHLFAFAYLLLISFAFFLISPIFGDNKH